MNAVWTKRVICATQVSLAKPVIALIGKNYHERQVNMRPNVVQVSQALEPSDGDSLTMRAINEAVWHGRLRAAKYDSPQGALSCHARASTPAEP